MTKTAFAVVSLMLITGLAAPCPVNAQIPERPKTKIVTGAVVDSDWVGSKIVVKWYDDLQDAYDELTVIVPDDALITKGVDTISFTDIHQDDKVKVEYYSDSFSGLKAARVTVQM
ncbi:MAG TPA: hypothetical protein PL155_07290 [Candidatus Omnitrophota bacterium]|nr:hypothetical protein [Candidatus Omnitrophota bacterium]HPD85363.1 hypothetical protein [Candidatus Omnitrophota bacterium]HRZ04136.1 hypothetical protein [Candidatus Omnitrophota bacterium]